MEILRRAQRVILISHKFTLEISENESFKARVHGDTLEIFTNYVIIEIFD